MESIVPPISKQAMPDNAKKVFSGRIFDVYQWEQELFDGTKTIFEKLKRADTVLVVPVTKEGRIVLTEQEQPGRPPFVSFAGGRVDEGESVIDAAKRELMEETGYQAEKFVLWEAVQPISKIDWSVYTLVAKGCKKLQEHTPEAGEKIKVKEISFDDFIEFACKEDFHEINITLKVLKAKLDRIRMAELKDLLSP